MFEVAKGTVYACSITSKSPLGKVHTTRHGVHYSVFNEVGELVGFFDFKPDGHTIEIGLGLRPELAGKGLGRAFITAGLAFGHEHFSVERWSLSVAPFNIRAIRLYEQVGFTPLNTFLQHTNGGEYEFLQMVRPA